MSSEPIPLEDLLASLASAGDLPVFWTPERRVDAAEFTRRISGLSDRLTATDVDRWVLVCEDGYAFSVGLFAAWHAGKVALLPPNPKPGTVRECMDAGDGLLTDRDEPGDVGPRLEPLDFEGDPGALDRLDPERTCTLAMTSGSTGARKTLPKKLANFQPDVDGYCDLWGGRLEGSTVISSVGHQHAFGLLFKILWPLSARHPVHPGQPLYPEDIRRCVQQAGRAHFVTSPSPLERLVRSGELSALSGCLEAVYSGGGVLDPETVGGVHDALGRAPIGVYGSTEAGGIAWRERPPGDEIPPWNPFPGVRHRIDEEGELQVRSPRVSPTLPEWYPTGDLAEPGPKGGFFLRGRRDRTVKVAEKSISLPELEQHLTASPLVEEACVLVANENDPDRRRVELGAAVVLTPEGTETRRASGDLETLLRSQLEPYCERVALPRHWLFLDRFPRDHMSKIQRDELRRRFGRDGPRP